MYLTFKFFYDLLECSGQTVINSACKLRRVAPSITGYVLNLENNCYLCYYIAELSSHSYYQSVEGDPLSTGMFDLFCIKIKYHVFL